MDSQRKPKREPAVCWCCNQPCPDGTRTDRAGWHSRRISIAKTPMVEIYCQACFAVWGWPELIQHPSGVSL